MPLFLDTETTGLSPVAGHTVVEIAIVDAGGRTVLNTLVDPERTIPWQATNVHGITDDMVRGQPTLSQLMPKIRKIVSNEIVVIYNSSFDTPFFPGHLKEALSIECAMRRYTEATGGGRWKKLSFAAQKVGHRWTGDAHRALADTLACRSVWEWLEISTSNTEATKTVRCSNCGILHRVPTKLIYITCTICHKTFR